MLEKRFPSESEPLFFFRWRKAARIPVAGAKIRETMKNTPRTAAIMPARDESETIAPMMPSTAPVVPRRQLSTRRPESVLVHRAAVMAGMIINAMTRIEPMDWKDVTATRETRLIRP